MLRATNNSKKIYVIPKVGYNHTLGRNGSLTETYKKEITEDESLPVKKSKDDKVIAGSINYDGYIEYKAQNIVFILIGLNLRAHLISRCPYLCC